MTFSQKKMEMAHFCNCVYPLMHHEQKDMCIYCERPVEMEVELEGDVVYKCPVCGTAVSCAICNGDTG